MADMTTTFGSGYGAGETQRKPFAAWLRGGFAALLAGLRRQNEIRRDIAYLQACDDHMLADLGLTRDQIEGAVSHGRDF